MRDATACIGGGECAVTRSNGLVPLGEPMPRDGAIIFRDLVGKLEVLNVECDKWARSVSGLAEGGVSGRGIAAAGGQRMQTTQRPGQRRGT